MTYNSIDTANILTNHAHVLYAAGIRSVFVYARTDRTPVEEIQGLRSVGMKLGTTFEKGQPVTAAYFTADQAKRDAELFLTWAQLVSQTKGSLSFPTADYDSNPHDLDAYLPLYHELTKAENYLTGLYAGGLSCEYWIKQGIAHAGWLTQSTGWPGYREYLPKADVIQGPSHDLLGFSVDQDLVVNSTVLW